MRFKDSDQRGHGYVSFAHRANGDWCVVGAPNAVGHFALDLGAAEVASAG